ncbi:molybdopterin-dependent oxidoreductase [Trichlorobacter ammonificans]|uniref:NADH dehydrogenase subunit G n=1 Tax=Trichlorobacter ammonificans TaxID=2916410 RepID=A0ABM9DCX9_9BACT|nr:molybdopterin-dependent oxidoreductase [Trichlorobacter ammonificans]CAH2032219.1 NADH dehydrogenase subunit G [Trichlorobacter ammonificans]
MVTLTIDDKQVSVEKDATIYDAAKAAGVTIPILCHDKKLKPFGACRMCLVEVEQMKGRLIPACTTPVTEGMIVRCTTPAVEKARKLVLELLMLNHPLDCPVCDKGGDCELQNLAYDHKVNVNRLSDEKFHHEIDYNNPLIERDQNRCVLCGKCVRICDEIVSRGALTFMNRGIETKIGTEFDGPLNCEFCGSCISVCPVGALLARPFKFKARFWALKKKTSVCGYCGTGCSLTLGVKDNAVLTTIYDENQGFHNGQLCVRGRFGYQFISSTKRLTAPLVRKNGELVETSWDEALALVAERLKSAGTTAAALATPRMTNEELQLLKQLMTVQVGTPHIDHSAGYAHTALTEGLKKSFGVAAAPSTILDIQKSDLLLVVKSDVYETHPVVGFEINMGVKNRDVKLRILSDKRGKLGRLPKAETLLHTPGTEVVLLNALAKVLIDENLAASAQSVPGYAELVAGLAAFTPEQVASQCGIAADEIRKLARDYAAAEKALIIFPTGLAYAGHDAQLAHAAANLAILGGKLGSEGAGLLVLQEKNNSQGAVDVGFIPAAGGCDARSILDGCAAGSIKTLLLAGENPLVSYPDHAKVTAALEKVEFLVVADLFLTETAQQADVVLPVCSYAEKDGTFTATDRRLQKIQPAITPVGQSRPEFRVYGDLIRALGGQAAVAPAGAFAEIAAYSAMSYDAIPAEGAFVPVAVTPRLVVPTAGVKGIEAGKLALLAGAALYHCGTLSQYGEGPVAVCPEGYLEVSRQDAAASKLADDDEVTVTSATGSIKLKVKISLRMPAGVVFSPYHFSANPINRIWSGAAVTSVTISK